MSFVRISACLGFAICLATACGSSSGGGADTDSGGGGGGPDAGNCGAMIECGGNVSYQKCTNSTGCYLQVTDTVNGDSQVACTSCSNCPTNVCGTGSGGASGSGGGSGSGGSGGAGGTMGSDGGSGDSGVLCSMDLDAGDGAPPGEVCVGCCQGMYPEGVSTFSAAVLDCVCTKPGACASECKTTFCAKTPTEPAKGSACDTCYMKAFATGGACLTPVENACNADPMCVSYLNCGNTCPLM